jgi:formate hydrogenlyase transcriptional activator
MVAHHASAKRQFIRMSVLHGSWHTAAQCLLASIAIALLTLVCFQLQFNLAATAFLYLIIVVLLSLKGSLLSSTAVSLIAVGCLAYYFAPPIFSFRVNDPFNLFVIITFFLTSTVITTLVSRAHSRAEQLVLINANLEAQIAERKQAEEGLRQSEERFRLIVETIPGLIAVMTPHGKVEHVNRRVLDYFGRTLEDLMKWGTTDAVHPVDFPRVMAAWQHSVETGLPYEIEHRIRRADGEYRWFQLRGLPLRDADGHIVRWHVLLTDIDAQKQSEEELRRSEMELRQILDLSPQQVAVFGPEGERFYASRTALDYVGVSLEEWRQTYGNFLRPGGSVHPEDRERATRAYWDATRSSRSAYELELRTKGTDGNYRWFLVRFNPLHDDKGQVKRWYVVSTDIDEHKRAEEKLRQENVALREEIDKASMFEEIVGTSRALKTVISHISKVAPSDSTVLISGETGTGKELVARAIHKRSNRASREFVSVNCAAIPHDLIASEFFGHEKGAFTGAIQQRLGKFELANGGTLFLDEVGDLPPGTQVALLRVLQEHEFERVGGTRRIRADVRVIAATNRDLEAAINDGSFRSDLFYRLNVFPIEMPSLRERRVDILLLVEYFIDRYARKAGKRFTTVDQKTLRLLESYYWPGNIRELQNVIERSVIVCETTNFSVDESWLSQKLPERKAESELDLPEKMASQEKEIIEAALRESQGRVFGPSGAAAKLGIARSTLESKIRSLEINKNRFKA